MATVHDFGHPKPLSPVSRTGGERLASKESGKVRRLIKLGVV